MEEEEKEKERKEEETKRKEEAGKGRWRAKEGGEKKTTRTLVMQHNREMIPWSLH